MAEDCILKQAILKAFVTLNGEFYFGGTPGLKNISLRVRNYLEFVIPKNRRKQGKVPISFTNQR